jgi:hypothetical protein
VAPTPKAPLGPRRAAATRLLFLAIVLSALALGRPSPALAGEYEVKLCSSGSAEDAGIVVGDDNRNGEPSRGTFVVECGASSGGLRQRKVGEVAGGQHWTLLAPPNTRLRHVSYERRLQHTEMSFVEWSLFAPVPLFHVFDAGAGFPPDKKEEFALNSTFLEGDLACPFLAGCPGGDFQVQLHELSVVLEDEAFPILFGPLVPSLARGTARIAFSATDAGAGLERATLFVDGDEAATSRDRNEERCEHPFETVVPCKQAINSSFPLDTTKLPDGQHQVQVSVTDATGQETKSQAVTFTVHNAPISSRRPAISGAAEIGHQLSVDSGAWDGSPTSFSYQWLRCPAAIRLGEVAGCAPIPDATGTTYTPVAADGGQREVVAVTARNAAGSGSTLSAPSDVVAKPARARKPPQISHVVLSRRRFRVGLGFAKGRGTVLRFSSSRPGHLTIVFERMRGGRGRVVTKLAAPVKSGRSSVLLTGEFAGRRLRPGRYRITIAVRGENGDVSAPARVACTVLPG